MSCRFVKIRELLISNIVDNHEYILTIEEGSIGGFSSAILNFIHNKKKTPTISKIKNIIFPDKFIDHNNPIDQYKEIGMDAKSIANKILSLNSSEIISFSNYKKN